MSQERAEHLREKVIWRLTCKHRKAHRIRETLLQTKIRKNLRSRFSTAIRNKQKTGSAVRDLGCTIKQFINHITELFQPGMSWSNWGEWHLDHIEPLATFNLADREQLLRACHYTNIRPLWAAENLSRPKPRRIKGAQGVFRKRLSAEELLHVARLAITQGRYSRKMSENL